VLVVVLTPEGGSGVDSLRPTPTRVPAADSADDGFPFEGWLRAFVFGLGSVAGVAVLAAVVTSLRR
jgi:hypothetical protein